MVGCIPEKRHLIPAKCSCSISLRTSFYDFPDRVFLFNVLSFSDHLTKQTDRHELDSDDNKDQPDKEQRTIAERRPAGNPLCDKVSINAQAGKSRYHSPHAEQMERPRNIAGGKEDGEQIEKSFKKSPRTELRFPIFSGAMLDDDLADPKSLPVRKRRNVAVQFAVDIDTFYHVAAVCFQTAV